MYCLTVAFFDILRILTRLALGIELTNILENLGRVTNAVLPLTLTAMEPTAAAGFPASGDALAAPLSLVESSHSLVSPRKKWVTLPRAEQNTMISALIDAT